jgi:hypothetical protein
VLIDWRRAIEPTGGCARFDPVQRPVGGQVPDKAFMRPRLESLT